MLIWYKSVTKLLYIFYFMDRYLIIIMVQRCRDGEKGRLEKTKKENDTSKLLKRYSVFKQNKLLMIKWYNWNKVYYYEMIFKKKWE